jgi:hypothetical protein
LGSVAAGAFCTNRNDDANEAKPTKKPTKGKKATMKILPASIEDQINRVDRQRSLYIGISSAVLAAWCIFRLIWLVYIALTFGVFFGALVFQFVLWSVIGAAAVVSAVGFLTRYIRGS